jgi:NAD-dependent dihydropyrimidine dehydrogenase PreA subunit
MRVENGKLKERWYPVIDQRRCKNCLECAEFCLFGVYAKTSDGHLAVAHPDACKPGCPACSRICPNQAIIFPLHDDDSAIAGAENAKVQPFDAETLAKIRKHREKAGEPAPQPSVLKTVVKACDCKPGSADSLPATRAPGGGNDSYFDQVISDVVKDS